MTSIDAISHKPVVVGIGEILWDLLPGGRQPGGAPANFAYIANCLGTSGITVSAVGRDTLGEELLGHLDALGLDRRYVQIRADAPTSTVSAVLNAAGEASYVIHENVAWDHLAWNDDLLQLAREADCVCFGSLAQRSRTSAETIAQFVDAASERCLKIFDINLRQFYYDKPTVVGSLERSNVLKLNDAEWPVVAELLAVDGSVDVGVPELMRRYRLRCVALTMGSRGSRLFLQDRTIEVPPVSVKVVDTIGAGDAYTAALAVGLLRGDEPSDIARHASAVAAFVCGVAGATPRQLDDSIFESVTL